MKAEIERIIKVQINKHLVIHEPIKNDSRCRLQIIADEASNEILVFLKNRGENFN